MSIETIISATIAKEGRYSNNPHDTGGETMWGITARVARANGYTGPMIDMPRPEAERIYASEYFIRPGFARISQLSPKIAEELFDTGVNCGVSVPSEDLQVCLNVLNRSHSAAPLYPDLVVDGHIGATTVDALRAFLTERKSAGETVLLRMLNSLQGVHYIEITQKRVKNEEFIYGWFLNRVAI